MEEKRNYICQCLHCTDAAVFNRSSFNLGGHGEDNIFGGLLLMSAYSLVWLLTFVGNFEIRVFTMLSIITLLICQTVIVFFIGALFGQMTSRKKTRQKGKADGIGP